MKVLMIITCPTWQRAPTLDALHKQGVDLFVLYLHAGGEKHGWGPIPLKHPHVIEEDPTKAAMIVWRMFRRGEVSVLCSFGYREPAQALALLLARARSVPVVVRSDSNITGALSSPRRTRMARRLLMKTLIPRSATAWTIGQNNEEFWRQEVGLTKTERIPYEVPLLPGGVPPTDRHSHPEHLLGILYVGRLSPEKGLNDLFDALHGLDARGVKWELTIVGKGPLEETVRSRAEVDQRIKAVGAVPYQKLDQYYRGADVLVLPSRYEPWGLTVNEALGFGVRVICTDQVGAGRDLINAQNGALFPVGDVDKLAELLADSVHFPRQLARSSTQGTADLMHNSLQGLDGGDNWI